jgi:hypothetical protein
LIDFVVLQHYCFLGKVKQLEILLKNQKEEKKMLGDKKKEVIFV